MKGRIKELFDELLSLLAKQPITCIDVYGSLDSRRFLKREFPSALPLRLEQLTFPAYEPPLQRWWLHWHDYYEIIVPLEGAGRFQVGDVAAPFEAGQLILVDTLKLHGGAEVTAFHRSLVIFFQAEMVAAAGGLEADRAFLAPLGARPDGSPPVLPPSHPAAVRVMEWILDLARAYYAPLTEEQRFPACKVALLGLLERLHAQFGGGIPGDAFQRREVRSLRLQKLLPYLDEHCTEQLTQPQVAKIAGMSPSRFRAFFKETTGTTFANYLRGLRSARAAVWLKTTDRSLADIAAEAGFADQSHLFRSFREVFGCGPMEYRKRERDRGVSK